MKNLTYISLFSSGGVGCYGFKQEGFDCIATSELIQRRLDVQKFNNKCKYETGYIGGDITQQETKNKILNEITKWKLCDNLEDVDVVVATPPCQGMSNANTNKNANDIFRNSLVIEAIEMVNTIKPKIFVFENVPAFWTTSCIASTTHTQPIGEYIMEHLGSEYNIEYRIINFKDYGAHSSRKRCLVIGVRKDLESVVKPAKLYPSPVSHTPTIRELIYDYPRLKEMGEFSPNDIYHFFRAYDPKMREWIKDVPEGMSAFDNEDDYKKPHSIKDGKLVLNSNKIAGKYARQRWDQVAYCVLTRNDTISSQHTLHPEDDRVFSIRELMSFMNVPNSFKWVSTPESELNNLSNEDKKLFLKNNEINIRQLLGEAVPTIIFSKVAANIKNYLTQYEK